MHAIDQACRLVIECVAQHRLEGRSLADIASLLVRAIEMKASPYSAAVEALLAVAMGFLLQSEPQSQVPGCCRQGREKSNLGLRMIEQSFVLFDIYPACQDAGRLSLQAPLRDYWRTAIFWLASTANGLSERSFAVRALHLIMRVLLVRLRPPPVQAFRKSQAGQVLGCARASRDSPCRTWTSRCWRKSCGFWLRLVPTIHGKPPSLPSSKSHSRSLDEPVFCRVSRIVGDVISSGNITTVCPEILPSLLRISRNLWLPASGGGEEEFPDAYNLYVELVGFVLSSEYVPGKVLWTLADTLPERVDFERCAELVQVYGSLGKILLETPNLKAKACIARVLCRLVQRDDCPLVLRHTLHGNLVLSLEWLEGSDLPAGLDSSLSVKYREALLSVLDRAVGKGPTH